MRFAAATVKDTSAHVQRFVAGNLSGGLDHLVIFLDQPGGEGQAEVAALLEAHPHVTCVRAGREWWGPGARPEELNERQCTNATAVRHVLADLLDRTTADHWLFHLDGDEVARLDEQALAAVPATAPAVRLHPREAVSKRSWDGEPTLFKRELDEADLQLLVTLGLIAEPTNRAYFHGHLQGKAGVRPHVPAFLGLHKVLDGDQRALPAHEDDRLEHFHYESYSGADFVRKWTAMVAAGPRASYRPGRARTARALRTLIEKDLEPAVLERYLLRIFERTTLDDADTLVELGLVLETDPLAGDHAPAAPPPGLVEGLAAGLEALRGEPKRHLFVGFSPR